MFFVNLLRLGWVNLSCGALDDLYIYEIADVLFRQWANGCIRIFIDLLNGESANLWWPHFVNWMIGK